MPTYRAVSIKTQHPVNDEIQIGPIGLMSLISPIYDDPQKTDVFAEHASQKTA